MTLVDPVHNFFSMCPSRLLQANNSPLHLPRVMPIFCVSLCILFNFSRISSGCKLLVISEGRWNMGIPALRSAPKLALQGLPFWPEFWAQFSMNLTKRKPYAYCMYTLITFLLNKPSNLPHHYSLFQESLCSRYVADFHGNFRGPSSLAAVEWILNWQTRAPTV
jgi:hypothetical protein